MKINKQNIRCLRDTVKCTNIYMIEVPEKEARERELKNI